MIFLITASHVCKLRHFIKLPPLRTAQSLCKHPRWQSHYIWVNTVCKLIAMEAPVEIVLIHSRDLHSKLPCKLLIQCGNWSKLIIVFFAFTYHISSSRSSKGPMRFHSATKNLENFESCFHFFVFFDIWKLWFGPQIIVDKARLSLNFFFNFCFNPTAIPFFKWLIMTISVTNK